MRVGSGMCARINVPTNDGRIIRSMSSRPLPIPVTMLRDENSRGHDGVEIVGRVTRTEFLSSSAEVFAAVEITEDWAIDALENLQHYMEIDLDEVDYTMVTADGQTTMDVTHGRLCSINLGTKPCWDGLEFRLRPA